MLLISLKIENENLSKPKTPFKPKGVFFSYNREIEIIFLEHPIYLKHFLKFSLSQHNS